jgi:hypothetical protein
MGRNMAVCVAIAACTAFGCSDDSAADPSGSGEGPPLQ